ncbi:MAG: hypothetical protein ACOY46_01615 [Bacillota bacterium]
MKKTLLLSLGDLRNISRDPMLLMVLIAPVLITALLKAGLPYAASIAWNKLAFDLTVHYPFILSVSILFIPMMVGMLVGFIILEDKDDNLLEYFAVTPVSKAGYLLYRITIPVVLTFIFSILMVLIVGYVPVNYLRLIPILLIASLEAPMMALFLGAFAANRIEGLALSKAFGIFLLAPFSAYLVESPWQLIAGIFPQYWVSRMFLASMEAGWLYGIYTITGLLLHAFYFYLLLGRFKRKV